jgi:hypothetical protein
MKSGPIILSIALALAVATGSQVRAQFAWSSVDSGCVVQSAGESLASIDAAHGTVSFKAGAAGDIKLTCPVRSLHQLAPNAVNGLGITFYMNNVSQCFILADLLRTNLNNVEAGASLATVATSGHSFSPGRQTLDQSLSEPLDFNTSYYWVDIQLHRDPSTATCNPLIVGANLQAVPADGLGAAQAAWSSVDSGCVVQSAGKNLASIDAAHGTVSFKTGAAGDIKLTCPVRSLHQVAPNAVNDLQITFYMNNVNQCFIQADLLRTNLNNVEAGASLATIDTEDYFFSPGRQMLNQSLSEPLDFNTSYYWVDIQLHRDSPTVMCNPLIVGTNLQALPQILETDDSNPSYLVGGVDQTLDPGWSSAVCGGREFLHNRTPLFEWKPIFGSEFDQPLVGFSGTIVEKPRPSDRDLPFTHPFGTDWEFHVAPDLIYGSLLAPSNGCTGFANGDCVNSLVGNNSNFKNGEIKQIVINAVKEHFPLPMSPLGVRGVLGMEIDQGLVPPDYRGYVRKGDRVAMFGRWIVDCGHDDFHSEMHPPLLMAFGRQGFGSSGQPATFSKVISRPYLVSQTFEDGKGVRHHIFNELLKGGGVPDCPPISTLLEILSELNPKADTGGCSCPWPLFLPCSTSFEARERFLPKPFAGMQTMSYIIRPPVPRQCTAQKLLVSTHFTVREGVSVSIEPYANDAARVIISMDDGKYTAPPLPPKADMSVSLDDIKVLQPDLYEALRDIRDFLLAVFPTNGIFFVALLQSGMHTDCYDRSYYKFADSTHPACGALPPLTAASPVDSQNVVVTTPIDQLSGPISVKDNSDGQVFPVYGRASVEWSPCP